MLLSLYIMVLATGCGIIPGFGTGWTIGRWLGKPVTMTLDAEPPGARIDFTEGGIPPEHWRSLGLTPRTSQMAAGISRGKGIEDNWHYRAVWEDAGICSRWVPLRVILGDRDLVGRIKKRVHFIFTPEGPCPSAGFAEQ